MAQADTPPKLLAILVVLLVQAQPTLAKPELGTFFERISFLQNIGESTATLRGYFPPFEFDYDALALMPKEERRLFVYQSLKQHATKTQASLREILDQHNISSTSVWISNSKACV
eukprot:m.294021 g.294021  ORF g.294021 m.294021 type:complete len:115 (-) comp36454_c0_seq1:1619-1963(-)